MQDIKGDMAPDAGFEPATKWLTATYSTAELIRNMHKVEIALYRIFLHLSRGLQKSVKVCLQRACNKKRGFESLA